MGKRTSYEPGTFSWVDLATTDQEGAKAFYSGLFGWHTEDSPIPGGGAYTMCSLDGVDVAGIGPLPEQQREMGVPPHWNNYVTVESADATADRVQELGGQVLAPAFDVMDAGRMAVLADPTGAPLSVWEPRDHIGAGLVNAPGTLTWNDLATTDVGAASSFFSDLFGWTFEELDTGGGPAYWVIGHSGATSGRNGGARELAPDQANAEIPPHWMPYFAVESADATAERAQELGGGLAFGPMDLPSGARIASLHDPQNAFFAIFAGEFDD